MNTKRAVVIAVLTALVFGTGAFFGGVEYEKASIRHTFEDAFSGLDDDLGGDPPATDSDEPSAAPIADKTIHSGQSARMIFRDTDEDTAEVSKITLNDFSCTKQRWTVSTGDDSTGELVGEDKDSAIVTPDAGKKFCVVMAALENVGDFPTESLSDLGNLVDSDGKQYSISAKASNLSTALDSKYGTKAVFMDDELQPGDSTTFYQVYEIPKDADPKSMLAEDSSGAGGDDGTKFAFDLR